MKNTVAGGLAALVLFLAVLGCGADSSTTENWKSDQPANRPPSNTAPSDVNNTPIDVNANSLSNTGVRECDELVDTITGGMDAENPDDNFVVRAAKNFAINRAKESVKQAIEDNKNNVGGATRRCQEIKRELDKAMTSPQQQQ